MTAVLVAPEVTDALATGRPVVALESTLIAHGLPRPDNLDVARRLEEDVRRAGAVPATVAVLDGTVRVGLEPAGLARVAAGDLVKLSLRDVPFAAALARDGATTVAATAALAARVGIRLFATGGLGGVHRQARESWDESADLAALARTPVVVVCSGVKSILDVPATLERLDSLGVPVAGFATDRFPGFYLTDSGSALDWRLDTVAEVAAAVRAADDLGIRDRALVVANPLPRDQQLDPARHDAVLEAGLAAAAAQGIRGKDVTPFLLALFHRETGGASLRANITLVRRNARLAAEIATALAS
jgi:pseudouridine-5'-phosphate glycosidase